MPDSMTLDLTRNTPTAPVSRCIELRPLIDRLGVPPLVVGVGRVVIGSATDADLRLAMEGVAGRHVELAFDGRRVVVNVLSPLTWLNDGPVRESELRAGDVLTLGPVELRVQFIDVPVPPPAPVEVESPPPAPRDARRRAASPRQAVPSTSPRSLVDAPPPPRIRNAVPSVETSIQPLLDEAEAAERLRRDLERLERETAWFQNHATSASTAPAVPPTDRKSRRSEHPSRLYDEEHLPQHRLTPVDARQPQDGPELDRTARDRDLVTAQVAAVQADRAKLAAEQRQLQELSATVRREQMELARVRDVLQQQQDQLAIARRTADSREQQLSERRAEFDAAVEALDTDRELLRRERDATQRDAAQMQQRLEARAADLEAQSTEAQAAHERCLRRTQDLDLRERTLHDRALQLESQHREQEVEWTRREAALRQKETALKVLTSEADGRQAENEQAAERVRQERRELEALRDQARKQRTEAERLQAELAAEREHLRTQQQSVAAQAAHLETEWERVKSLRTELDGESQRLAEATATLTRREAECRALRRDLEAQQQVREEHEQRWSERTSELDRQAAALESRAALLQHESQTTRSECSTERQQLAEARRELDAQRRRLAAEQLRLTEWNTHLTEQQVQLESSLSNPVTEVAALRDTDLAARAAELDARQAELEQALEAFELAQADLRTAQATLAAEWEEAAEWRRQWTSGEHIQPAVVTCELSAEQSLSQEHDTLAAIIAERDRLRMETAELRQAHDAIEEEFRWMQAEADRTKAEREALQQGQTALACDTAELARLREELQAAGREAEEQHRQLQASWDQLLREQDQLQSRWDALEAKRESLIVERELIARIARPASTTNDIGDSGVDSVADGSHWNAQASEEIAYGGNAASELGRPGNGADAEPQDVFESADRTMDDDGSGRLASGTFAPHSMHDAYLADENPTDERSRDSGVANEAPSSPPASATDRGIRSQLAMLFGLTPDVLDQTEAQHQPEVDARAYEPQTSAIENSDAATTEAAAPPTPLPLPERNQDSVAAYMQQLLSRTQPAGPVAPPAAPALEHETDEPGSVADRATTPPSDEDEAATARAARSNRRLDKEELAELRANIDNMRQIANLSARSAVALHFSRKLAVTYKVKLILTIVGAALSLILLTAEFWTSNSYRLPGICALVVTLIAGIELIRTTFQIRRVRQIAGIKAEDEAPTAGTAAEATV